MSRGENNAVSVGCEAMLAEANAIKVAANRLNDEFDRAVRMILETGSKLVICGIGKSGHIGCKMAATFSSCGVPTVFLHAAEAIHGDLGVYQAGDPTIVLSKSGSTSEVLRLMPMFKKLGSPTIAIVGNVRSPIAEHADVVIDASVETEADPLNLMPTSSSTVTLAIGDALAAALVKIRGFTAEQFAVYHPGGQLGRNLLMTVADVMHEGEKVALAREENTVREVVMEMTRFPLGGACVLDEDGHLLGLMTDGDVRRLLAGGGDILSFKVGEYMTANPVSGTPDMLLGKAVKLMEERPSQISVLPIVSGEDKKFVGLLRLHDVYQPSLT